MSGLLALLAASNATPPEPPEPPHVRQPALADYTPTSYLAVPSPVPDGADAYHPDVIDTVTGWQGYRYWMGFTPWPSDAYENPCVVASHDGTTWVVPSGGSNPIDPTPFVGYNSDTDLVLARDEGLLYCVYRWFGGQGWYYRTSADGVRWSPEGHVYYGGLSPALVRLSPSSWRFWSIGSDGAFMTGTSSSLTGPWVAQSCSISLPPGGYTPWHVDVIYWEGKFYGLLYCHNGTNPSNMIVGMVSGDGVDWGESTDILMRPNSVFSQMYRATMQPAGDGFDIWAGLTLAIGGHRIARSHVPLSEFS